MKRRVTIIAGLMVLCMGVPAWAIGGSTADLYLQGSGTPTYRTHSDQFGGHNLLGQHFNIYTGTKNDFLGLGFSSVDSLASGFIADDGSHIMTGTLRSEVYRHTDGHLLFAYQVENTGLAGYADIAMGNIAGFGEEVGIIDSGLFHFGGDADYASGDVLRLARLDDGQESQLAFNFEARNENWSRVERWLEVGQTSSWFYVETDAEDYGGSIAVVQDGLSADKIPVLVPATIPEPLTMLGVMGGIAAAGIYSRKRRKKRAGE